MSITVDRIIELANQKEVTMEFINELIGGYHGKTKAWKTGRLSPTFSELTTIANFFNVSLDYLLGNTFDPEPPAKKKDGEPLPSRTEMPPPTAVGESFLYLVGAGGIGKKIVVPPEKVERLQRLLEAGFPELLE